MREFRQSHVEDKKLKAHELHKQLRQAALDHYGSVCACCGETRIEFLCIDHVNGGGSKHRKTLKVEIYRWFKQNDYPAGFRVLCHNCNASLGFYGYCPHQPHPVGG